MTGVIGFFDILGYQSFLENNSATESALRVLELITNIPVEAHTDLKTRWEKRKGRENLAPIAQRLKHLIFSDTILLTIPFEEGDSEELKEAAVAYMIFCSSEIQEKMFIKGLPLRGVVHVGDHIVKDTCFAGRGIVDAYRICNTLDFAGTVVSPTLFAQILENQKREHPQFRRDRFDTYFVQILSPLKDNKEARLCSLNWVQYLDDEQKVELHNDVIQFVMKHFWAHGKDCPTTVDSKIRNTCKIVRRLMLQDVHFKPGRPAPRKHIRISKKTTPEA